MPTLSKRQRAGKRRVEKETGPEILAMDDEDDYVIIGEDDDDDSEVLLEAKTSYFPHKSRSIRRWADSYLQTGKFPYFGQGKYMKTHSIVTDENVQELLKTHLRRMKDEDRTPENFRQLLNDNLLSEGWCGVGSSAIIEITVRTILEILRGIYRELWRNTFH